VARAGSLHAVLLAGGSGTRFWPLSRERRPKQFLALTGRRSLLEQTFSRVRRLVPPERIWVVAPPHLAREVRRVLPRLRRSNLIEEPAPRDTAPAVALACARLVEIEPEAVVAIFPTDHHIEDIAAFARSVRAARDAARDGALVCLGVRPDRPATGYGYVRCARRPRQGQPVEVRQFVEKPDVARARRFIRSGRYCWNAGMFVWCAQRFLDELRRTAPAVHRGVRAHLAGDARAWQRVPRGSVDYAVMEHARGVQLVALESDWSDVGSWDAAARLREKARKPDGPHLRVDSPGSVVFGAERPVVLVDVPDVVVVDTPDALLVVSREHSEKVKAVVDTLRKKGRGELL